MIKKSGDTQTGKHPQIKLMLLQPVLVTSPETIIVTLLPKWIKPQGQIPLPVLKDSTWPEPLGD